MIAVALVALALIDGALLGFRAAAGRAGLVDQRRDRRRAIAIGVAYAAAIAVGGVLLALALTALQGPALWPELLAAGGAAVRVYTIFAMLVLAALALWLIPVADLRTAVSVTVLGPGTMARPWVLLAGLASAVATRPRWEVALLALYAAAAMLPLERWLTPRYFAIDPALLAR